MNTFFTSRLITFPLLIATLMVGCSTKISTKIDYNPNTDFSQFKNFTFAKHLNTGLDTNPIMLNRIEQSVQQNLLAQGLQKSEDVSTTQADLTISVNFSQEEKENNSSFSIGLGTGSMGRHGGGSLGVSTNVPIEGNASLISKISINMSHDGKAIWHGSDNYEVKKDATSSEMNQAVLVTVNRILANYPPKKE